MRKRKTWKAQLEAAMAPSLFKDERLNQAMEDAADILRWREPRVKTWRIYRLAQALIEKDRKHA